MECARPDDFHINSSAFDEDSKRKLNESRCVLILGNARPARADRRVPEERTVAGRERPANGQMNRTRDVDYDSWATIRNLTCRLVVGHVRNCGYISSGLDCGYRGRDVGSDFLCDLNIDIQNETSYFCNLCNETVAGDGYNASCGFGFKLIMDNLVFESALKNIWLKLPYWLDEICEIFPWESQVNCVTDELYVVNRTLHEDTSTGYETRMSFKDFNCVWNIGKNFSRIMTGPQYDWSFLFVILFIVAGGVGNILVCLAVCLDKRLQNVTNYFLLSLAIADLLVSLFVMPMGAIPGFLGLGLVKQIKSQTSLDHYLDVEEFYCAPPASVI
ncbi:5-hydroxytryptamine receptor 2B [Eumeta japonica]|uniref:5-hydroxytryptamine receptor 2B n=1 Tax=Eumeta variegata TaxID=151549 RepID=A0A4C1SEF9_EUMVA|nr:5-hydroxytryptamine receptor 2B [Eumeta japonica]